MNVTEKIIFQNFFKIISKTCKNRVYITCFGNMLKSGIFRVLFDYFLGA